MMGTQTEGEDPMAITIDVATLVDQLPQLLERVRRGREHIIIEQDGKPVATLAPPPDPVGATAEQIAMTLGKLRMPDPEFADDLERIQGSQPKAEFPEWLS